MSGLNPQDEKILELAMMVTTQTLDTVAESPTWVIYQPDTVLDKMDAWNQRTHTKTGLIQRVRESRLNETQVEDAALAWVAQYLPPSASPLCGSSIGQDRRFMARWMPRLEAFFHYRNLDVSTLKELCRRWAPAVYRQFKKKGEHQALADIRESIAELQFYREHFLRPASV